MSTRKAIKGLEERLKDGESIIVAEGYLFEFERRGYLQAGAFVPEIVLEHPQIVRQLYEEFVHAGSDIVLAFTASVVDLEYTVGLNDIFLQYYAHRQKLKLIGREDDLEKLNRKALKMAREVADETGTLMAASLSKTMAFIARDSEAIAETKKMFREQVQWAYEEGVDFMVGETLSDLEEAMYALEAIKEFGLPAVITLSSLGDTTRDNHPYTEALKKLEDAGADAVGLNCIRGPATMLPLMKEIRDVCKGPLCALPVVYRTSPDLPSMQSLTGVGPGGSNIRYFDLPAWQCSRTEIQEFAREARAIGIQYVGLCCGNASHYIREVAETLGRSPPASRYSPDMGARHDPTLLANQAETSLRKT
ncbi:betaine--homocysteine S-methyltransferase 1-like [Lingula anatina]|uniref:Betaine--homocysteine S-methyltransferase 1-like n=1 Tax=Lingula anatina TaxID=7574 RepID=A0A2R2MKV7_LINAN|nr:betaine--homocysteine S-methyltransferase 1-like [Lingula anatina]|eukprot:XP_023930843.1 betaine--homocysteine S-methyltransferase 1-like [Lingula anatina]